MKKFTFLFLIAFLLNACNTTKQEQRSMFPFPCTTTTNRCEYYIDETGAPIKALNDVIRQPNDKDYTTYAPGFFKDGLLSFEESSHFTTEDEERYLYINPQGEIVVDVKEVLKKRGERKNFIYHPSNCHFSDFSEGIAFIEYSNRNECFAIDKNGNELFDLDGEPLTAFNGGYAIFYKNYKYGVINTKGEVVLEPNDSIINEIPSQGLICFEGKDDLRGAMDIKGNVVVKPISTTSLYFEDNDCAIFRSRETRNYGVINKNNEIVIEPKYDELVYDGDYYWYKLTTTEDDENGYHKYTTTTGWLTHDGKVAYESFEYVFPFYGSDITFFHHKSDNDNTKSTMYINEDFKLIGVDPNYMLLSPFVNGIALGYNEAEDYCALIDKNNINSINPEVCTAEGFHEVIPSSIFYEEHEEMGKYAIYPWWDWKWH